MTQDGDLDISPAVMAVEALIAHIEAQDRERKLILQQGKKWKPHDETCDPSSEVKKDRKDLLTAVKVALNLTPKEFLDRLGINRATYDRWANLSVKPAPAQIARLRTLAQGGDATGSSLVGIPAIDLKPERVLDEEAHMRTWGRLRLVYSLFRWEIVIFYYSKPYRDVETVSEIALLALSDSTSPGAKIIYIMKRSEFKSWSKEFVQNCILVFGEIDASRVCSRICAILVDDIVFSSEDSRGKFYSNGLGIFNYGNSDETLTTGYQWKSTSQERPSASDEGVYEVAKRGKGQYMYIYDRYDKLIKEAERVIDQRLGKLTHFWQSEIESSCRQELLLLPRIDSQGGQRNGN